MNLKTSPLALFCPFCGANPKHDCMAIKGGRAAVHVLGIKSSGTDRPQIVCLEFQFSGGLNPPSGLLSAFRHCNLSPCECGTPHGPEARILINTTRAARGFSRACMRSFRIISRWFCRMEGLQRR